MYKKIDEFINVGDIKPELKVYNLNDFCELKVPPREHILSPWLYTQSMAMIHAPRGIGKTHMGLSIAYAAATAGEFLKWKAPKERNVIYVDGEMPTSLLQERLKLLNKNELNVTNLKIIASGQQYFGIPDLSRKEEQINFDKYIDPDTDLIIFDNISTLFRTGKENESESWTNAQSWTLSLRARGITVIFIHHSGKNGQQRGTSRREDVLDVVINLKKPISYNPQDGAYFEVHFEKSREVYGEGVAPFAAKLDTKDSCYTWAISPVQKSLYESIVNLHNNGLSQTQIIEELSVAKGTVSKNLKIAREEMRIL